MGIVRNSKGEDRNHPSFRVGLRNSGRLQEQGFGLGVDQDVHQLRQAEGIL